MTAEDEEPSWVYFDPGMPPQLGGVDDLEFKIAANGVIRKSSQLDPTDGERLDIGPAGNHNNPLGLKMEPGMKSIRSPALRTRSTRCRRLTTVECSPNTGADGPDSETPPGHWNVIANEVADHPRFEQRFEGEGPILSDVEWDLKVYWRLTELCTTQPSRPGVQRATTTTPDRFRSFDTWQNRVNHPIQLCHPYDPQGLLLEDGTGRADHSRDHRLRPTRAPGGRR